MIEWLARLSRALSRASLLFAGFGLVVMTAIIFAQVVSRYGFGQSLAWSEQAALVLMVYFILIAAAVGVREGFHIRLTLLSDNLPRQFAHVLGLLSHAVVLAFGVAMGFWGIELCERTWAHSIPTLGIPRGLGYLPIPLAGWLIAIFSFEHLIARVRGTTVEPLWN
jgi:TRAP-type C4-dicarboxylate transport system permease small subunit